MARLKIVTAEDIKSLEREELQAIVFYLSKIQYNLSNELKKLGLVYTIDSLGNVHFEKGVQ